MSQTNEVFENPDQASYELGYLLRALPERLNGANLTEQQHLEIEAADLHAMNCAGTLVRGLQALGRVMWSASVNEQYPVGERNFGDIALMVTEIALQLQFLDEFRQSVTEYELREAKAGVSK